MLSVLDKETAPWPPGLVMKRFYRSFWTGATNTAQQDQSFHFLTIDVVSLDSAEHTKKLFQLSVFHHAGRCRPAVSARSSRCPARLQCISACCTFDVNSPTHRARCDASEFGVP
jgi:hypothetical protein